MVPWVLAVDGGQTSTVALLATPDGTICGAGLGGPANHIHEPGGMERLRQALHQAIRAAFAALGLEPIPVAAACFGMTGGMDAVPEVVATIVPCQRLRVEHDTVTALASASGGRPGIVVIAGSGAIAYGRRADGREVRVGGWGYLMGDEGSGYDIAMQALRAVTQAEDGRSPATLLQRLIPEHFGLPDLQSLHAALYAGRIGRPEITAIARVVSVAAQQGDSVALGLLRQAGRHLGLSAAVAIRRLELTATGATVYPVGGVFQAGRPVLSPFKAVIRRHSPRSQVQPPLFHHQVVGALLLALQDYGITLDAATLARIQASLNRLEGIKAS